MDGRIIRCGIISSCQSGATSEIVKHSWACVHRGAVLYQVPDLYLFTFTFSWCCFVVCRHVFVLVKSSHATYSLLTIPCCQTRVAKTASSYRQCFSICTDLDTWFIMLAMLFHWCIHQCRIIASWSSCHYCRRWYNWLFCCLSFSQGWMEGCCCFRAREVSEMLLWCSCHVCSCHVLIVTHRNCNRPFF